MILSASALSVVFSFFTCALCASLRVNDVDPSLIPPFGVEPGVNPDGTGNCDGVLGSDGQPILIPCSCPPDRDNFVKELNSNVAAGHVLTNPTVLVSFPTDDSQASQLARLNAAAVTLQNLQGPGVGCPIASTTFAAQQEAILGETSTTPPSSPTSPTTTLPSSPTSTPSTPASGIDPALVPQFGVTAGVNPDGTGNCDGIDGPDGQPILIPCSCPPDRDSFIKELSANVAAGFVLTNPSVPVSFPTDDSPASQLARLNAAAVTLQNLNGPGVGCPTTSTTWDAQRQAILNGEDTTDTISRRYETKKSNIIGHTHVV